MEILKPIPFKIPKSESQALLVQVDEMPFFYNHLHYHPEIQVTAILKGDGIFYAGNTMSSFAEGDVFVIGSDVPHLLKCSNIYQTPQSPGVKGVSLFFKHDSFGKGFFEIEEMLGLKALLKDANRVIKIGGSPRTEIFNKIINTPALAAESLIISFLEILSMVGKAPKSYLNSEQYNLLLNRNEGGRLNEILDFTFKYYQEEITIEQIAKVAHLSRSQFSSFFKLHTGNTYIRFLNDLRIENACILLRSNNDTIEKICYDVGFQNVSNFARQFKKVKGRTPSAYRMSWRNR